LVSTAKTSLFLNTC